MIVTLKQILAAAVLGDVLLFLLLCAAVWLLLSMRRRERKSPKASEPSARDRERAREVREDAEAWKRLQSYSAEDAYGRGSGG